MSSRTVNVAAIADGVKRLALDAAFRIDERTLAVLK